MSDGIKLLSWNVNGLRSVLKKGFNEFVEREAPEILCLQETKAGRDPIDPGIPTDYHQFTNNNRLKMGQSGTAVFTKIAPLNMSEGLGEFYDDQEGRVQTLEFDDFYLVNVYTPNSRRDLSKLQFRADTWDPAFTAYVSKLAAEKPVVFCGDLNMAAEEIDLARPKANRRNAGFTDEERAQMPRLREAGFLDSFREFTPDPGHYTWWSFRPGVREKNIGWRLDYFLVSKSLRDRMDQAFILPEVMGSDHCPVGLVLK
jgi:exodeoxyribonuclease-3